MSRKRQRRREKDDEMARQLGVKTLDEKARELVAKGRVGHVELRPRSLRVTADTDGFLAKRRKRVLHCGVSAYLVDGHGVHLVTQQIFETEVPKGDGVVALDAIGRTKQDVRYERPAHFVVVVEGNVDTPALDMTAQSALPMLSVDGAPPLALNAPEVGRRFDEPPLACVVVAGNVRSSASVVTLAGVHKQSTQVTFTIDHQRLSWSLDVDLRV